MIVLTPFSYQFLMNKFSPLSKLELNHIGEYKISVKFSILVLFIKPFQLFKISLQNGFRRSIIFCFA